MKKVIATLIFFFFTIILFAQNGWIQRTNLPADGRHRATGCGIGNKGYLGLGHVNGFTATINYADWWEYDPASDSWTQKANYPTVNYGAVCFVADGKAFVGGGAFLNGEFYAYSPVTNVWTSINTCPISPGDQGAMSINNKGYVHAGLMYEYDPATGQWTPKTSPPITFGTWCVAFSTATSGFVKSGSSLYEYKPLNDQWTPRAQFPGLNTNGAAAVMHNGNAYVVSGYVGSLNNVTPEVWEYNPGNNVWSRMADFPGNSRRFTVAFTINDKGFFGTGTHGINLNDFWELDEPVGLNEESSATVVKVFPSPADEFVQIDFSSKYQGDEYQIKVYDVNGVLVRELQTEYGVVVLNRNGLAAGMYMFVASANGFNHSGKIMFR